MAVAVSSEQQADSFVHSAHKLLIDGEWVEAASGKTFPTINPATEETLAEVAHGRGRGHRPRGPRRAARVRRRLAVAADERIRSRPADLEDRRADRGERRRAGDARDARQREAVRDRPRRRRAAGGRPVPLHGGLADQDRGHDRADLGAPGARRVPRLHAARAGRRRRSDHPVELPAADGGVEARPGRWPAGAPWCSSPPSRRRCPRSGSASCCRRPGSPTAWSTSSPASATPAPHWPAHDDVDKVAFTGSTEVGKLIVKAAAGNLKKVSLELGGKSPNVVYADADLEAAIPGAANAIFFNHGQCCNAGSRLYVQKQVFDDVVAGVSDAAKSIKVAPGTEPDSQMGPLISDEQFEKVLGYLESGKDAGRRGGRRRRSRRRSRLLRAADRAHEHLARHEGRARGDLRAGRVRDPVRLSRRDHRAGERHQLRACRGRVHPRHLQGPSHRQAAARRAPCGSTPTTCSTPRCRSAATRSPVGAARWVTRSSTTTSRRSRS